MRKTLGLLILLCLICPRAGISQPLNILGNQVTATVSTANTFLNPLPQQTGRQSCWIQYEGSGTGYVFFGASPTTPSSFQLTNKQFIYCDDYNSTVDGNAVWLTSSPTADSFVIKVK
jgi:hypothetical protein